MAADAQNVGFKKIAEAETDYGTGAKRDFRRGKGAQKWLPHDAIDLVSHVYEEGNLGRGWRNWEFGMPLEDLLDSAKRHISRYIAGDRSEPHIPQAIWNLLNALQMSIWVWQGVRPKSLNNLPDHRHFWYPDSPSPCLLSDKEIEWLKGAGLSQDTANVDDKYLAGIVDGEGTIALTQNKGYYARVSVYNNSYPLLEKLLAHFPSGHITQAREATEIVASSYVLSWSGQEALTVIKRIAPFLVIKKRQADLVVRFFMLKDLVNQGFVLEVNALRAFADMKNEMHDLNKKGPKDPIPTPMVNATKNSQINIRQKAEDFLRNELANGACALKELLEKASNLGLSEDALKQAKKRLGIASTGIGSKSLWKLKSKITDSA